MELVVSLGLLAVVSSIAVPATSQLRNQYLLGATADQIAVEIGTARMRAVGQGVVSRMRFTDDGFVMETSEDGSYFTAVGEPFPLPAGITVDSSGINPTFGRTGLAASPVTISLAQDDVQRTLVVNVLGRVSSL